MLPAIYRQYDTDDKVLKRFLDIYGSEFDVIKSYSEYFPNIYDVDKCNIKFFPYLAQYLGANYYYVILPSQVRKFLGGVVDTYTIKGTKNGIQDHVETLTGWTALVVEDYMGMMLTNTPGFYTFDQVAYAAMVALYGVTVAYAMLPKTWNGSPLAGTWLHITIYCWTNGDPQRTTKEDILNQSLITQVPVGVTWQFVYLN
jgi:phage tail-like protein